MSNACTCKTGIKCIYCNGRGWHSESLPGANSFWNVKHVPCNKCKGTGRLQHDPRR